MASILELDSISLSVLGAILTVLGGIYTYYWQVKEDRETNMQERRKDLYEKLLRSIFELMTAKSGSDKSKCISNIEKNWLFASDTVLKACYKFLEIYNKNYIENASVAENIKKDPAIKKDFENSLADIFLEMRKDINRITHTEIDPYYAYEHVKIYDWGILSGNE